MKRTSDESVDKRAVDRRRFLSTALGAAHSILHLALYLCSLRPACVGL
jgi:hypothetical protein